MGCGVWFYLIGDKALLCAGRHAGRSFTLSALMLAPARRGMSHKKSEAAFLLLLRGIVILCEVQGLL